MLASVHACTVLLITTTLFFHAAVECAKLLPVESVGLLRSKAVASNNYPTIVVDKSGRGHFRTIQAAIDSIRINNNNWIRVSVKAGIYNERVSIPRTKPYILLQGEGSDKTQIVAGFHQDIAHYPTFDSTADNFVAMNIAFVNSYNYPLQGNRNRRLPAVAARVEGDNSAFYNCAFLGAQDTLWDVAGRHYFSNCHIVGSVDFIFGAANSVYKQCLVTVLPVSDEVGPGYITAHGRRSGNLPSGFVFNQCTVVGAPAYLGRPWGPSAKVVFMNSRLNINVPPQGWDIGRYGGHEKEMEFSEYQCTGTGSNTAGRVKWEHGINGATVAQFQDLDFNGASIWLRSQPHP